MNQLREGGGEPEIVFRPYISNPSQHGRNFWPLSNLSSQGTSLRGILLDDDPIFLPGLEV